MKKLMINDFEKFEIENLNSLNGGNWCFTGEVVCGHHADMDINGHLFISNGDGTYSKPK